MLHMGLWLLYRWVVASVDSVPIDRALTDVNYTRLAPIENEWQTFYPLGAIFETVHMEAPPPKTPQGGPLTTVRITKETTTGPVRRLQVAVALSTQERWGGGGMQGVYVCQMHCQHQGCLCLEL